MAVQIPAQVDYINLISKNALEDEFTDNLNKGFGKPLVSTYNYIDQVARALCGLTTNTYSDSITILTKSVNEALAEDDG